MSDCHSSPGRARSKRRGGLRLRFGFGRDGGFASPSSFSVFCTVFAETRIPWKRASQSRTLRMPKSGI